jgi:hypothetical protein
LSQEKEGMEAEKETIEAAKGGHEDMKKRVRT